MHWHIMKHMGKLFPTPAQQWLQGVIFMFQMKVIH